MELVEELAYTAEVCGANLTQGAATLMIVDLQDYPEDAVRAALARCRRELRKGAFTLSEVLTRIDDGRPEPDVAWGMLTWKEDASIALTTEMERAQGVAWALYHSGDKTAARMAFRAEYQRLVAEARAERRPPEWTVSLGTDPAGRAPAIEAARSAARISGKRAPAALPSADRAALPGDDCGDLVPMPPEVRERLERLLRGPKVTA